MAVAEITFARNKVKLEPAAVLILQDALGPEDLAVFFLIGKLIQHAPDFFAAVTVCRLDTDVLENLVGIVAFAVMMVVVMMLVVMMMLMVLMVIVIFMVIIVVIIIVVVIIMMVFMMMLMFILIVVMVSRSR